MLCWHDSKPDLNAPKPSSVVFHLLPFVYCSDSLQGAAKPDRAFDQRARQIHHIPAAGLLYAVVRGRPLGPQEHPKHDGGGGGGHGPCEGHHTELPPAAGRGGLASHFADAAEAGGRRVLGA